MGACSREISSLPILSGCPGNGEYFFMTNAEGGLGQGKYALRSVADIRNCFLSKIKVGRIQIVVGVTLDGDGNVIMTDTSTQLVISQTGIINGSVWITNSGPEMPEEADGVAVAYYGAPLYDENGVTVNFIQPFGNSDNVTVHFLYIES